MRGRGWDGEGALESGYGMFWRRRRFRAWRLMGPPSTSVTRKCILRLNPDEGPSKVPFPTNFCDAATHQLTMAESFSRFSLILKFSGGGLLGLRCCWGVGFVLFFLLFVKSELGLSPIG